MRLEHNRDFNLWGPWTGAALNPAPRRAYLKHRSMVLPVLLVLAVAAMIFGCLVALSGWQAPQL